NKLYDFPKYIKLSADNTSFVPTNFTTTIAETNGSTIVVISAPTVKTQYFAINICDLLFPLIISFFIALFWVNSVAIKNPANVLTIKLKNSGTVKKIKTYNSFKFANSNDVPAIYHHSETIKEGRNVYNPNINHIRTITVLFRHKLTICAFIILLIFNASCELRKLIFKTVVILT